jgi:fructosamine-3-kinase
MARGARVSGLIDPACFHGHAEADFAMLALFASPPSAFWESYGAVEAGLAERRPVYQLWPALVHLRLVGARYRGLVERLLAKLGA